VDETPSSCSARNTVAHIMGERVSAMMAEAVTAPASVKSELREQAPVKPPGTDGQIGGDETTVMR